jgi:sec-independent protein translocase protein TatB
LFDVAFSEILVIAVVALIVIGPEKLPKVARTLGVLAGRLQRYASTVKADIDRELHIEDMRKLGQETQHSILSTQTEITTEAAKAESEIQSALDTAKSNKPDPSA